MVPNVTGGSLAAPCICPPGLCVVLSLCALACMRRGRLAPFPLWRRTELRLARKLRPPARVAAAEEARSPERLVALLLALETAAAGGGLGTPAPLRALTALGLGLAVRPCFPDASGLRRAGGLHLRCGLLREPTSLPWGLPMLPNWSRNQAGPFFSACCLKASSMAVMSELAMLLHLAAPEGWLPTSSPWIHPAGASSISLS
ncbi:hypothetical protein XELAEV_18026975mg [Xenopus laevis]|uniref:Uncharacterized protein n=1 Tax=Xenopus laevis TaxID=8355 RepID=A0A974HJV4_XENLA|nr:hypothetical protein XELAEV_18026975mg [Xenopus laevis]